MLRLQCNVGAEKQRKKKKDCFTHCALVCAYKRLPLDYDLHFIVSVIQRCHVKSSSERIHHRLHSALPTAGIVLLTKWLFFVQITWLILLFNEPKKKSTQRDSFYITSSNYLIFSLSSAELDQKWPVLLNWNYNYKWTSHLKLKPFTNLKSSITQTSNLLNCNKYHPTTQRVVTKTTKLNFVFTKHFFGSFKSAEYFLIFISFSRSDREKQ